MKKRILSILTALALCLCLTAVPALAYTVGFSGGDGGYGAMEPVYDVSGDYTLPESHFTYWNGEMQFKGWEIDGELYDPGDVYTVNADTTVCAVWEFIGGEVTVYFDNSLTGWDYVSAFCRLDNGELKNLGDIAYGNGAAQTQIVCALPANAVSVYFRNYLIGQPEDSVPGGYQSSRWMDVEPGKVYHYIPRTEPEPELKHYTVTITGLSYGIRARVPAGMSLNQAYCDQFEIDDFSETLDTEKEGYTFLGWYTDPDFARDSKFSFDDPVECDLTIYPRWEKKVEPITQVTVIRHNKDGSVTTTVNDLVSDILKRTTEYPDGTTVAVVTDRSGGVSVEAALPEGTQEVTVTVPYETCTDGTVALLVDENGMKRLLTGTVVDVEKQTVTLTLTGSGKVEIVNNDKQFDDVSPDDRFADAVNYVTAGGLLDGVSETSFDPEGIANRALLVTALWRLEGAPVVNYLMTYSDVEQDAWYAEAVRWAASEGLVNGFPDGTFRPGEALTREQLATLLYRYEQYCGGGFTGMWMFLLDCTDREQVAQWAYEPLCWMTMKEVMQKDGSGALKPRDAATRAELAQTIMNYLEQEKG